MSEFPSAEILVLAYFNVYKKGWLKSAKTDCRGGAGESCTVMNTLINLIYEPHILLESLLVIQTRLIFPHNPSRVQSDFYFCSSRRFRSWPYHHFMSHRALSLRISSVPHHLVLWLCYVEGARSSEFVSAFPKSSVCCSSLDPSEISSQVKRARNLFFALDEET